MKAIKKARALFDRHLLRFLLVGVLNTLVGSALMFGLYNLAGSSYPVATAANVILTSILSYFLNKYFTFEQKQRSAAEAVRFALTIAVSYFVAYGVAKPLCLRLLSSARQRVQENAAMLTGMCLFSALNYLGQRIFTFRLREAD